MFEIVSDKIENIEIVQMCEIIDNKICLDKEDTNMVFIMTGKIKYLPKTYNKFTIELDTPKEIEKFHVILKKDIDNLEKPIKNSSISVKCNKKDLENFQVNDRIKIATSVNLYTIEEKTFVSFNLEQIKKEKKLYF